MPSGPVRVRWTRKALANLDAEAAYIAQDNPQAARAVVERIQEAVSLLANHPALGRPGRVPGTRELVIPDTPYILPYRVRGKGVEILRILHTARKWPENF